MFDARKLRHRVVIQKPVETQNSSSGAVVTTWEDIATVWCAIEPLSVKELIAAQAEDSKVSARITMRYRRNISHEMRLYHAGKNQYYNIEGILADKMSGLDYITVPVSEGLRYQEGDDVIPVILEEPEITGTPSVGQTLTADIGVWANDPTDYLYQWYLEGVEISGANGVTIVVPNNIGDEITFGVISSNNAGDSEEAISDAVVITA